ncbi:MAG: tRNA epoxyqueuosine(34) reductase QueG [Thermomicrobiales bacterium]
MTFDSPVRITLQLTTSASPRDQLTAAVKRMAFECGLTVSAVTTADPFPDLADHLSRHIDAGHLDGMDWYTHERAAFASDVRNLQASAVSILSVGIAYWPGPTTKPEDGIARGRISRYAWGKDYHRVLKRRMNVLLEKIAEYVDRPVDARNLVDTARVVDRAIAARSGLGWYGKHSCIIVPGHGSWVLLGELLLDLELTPDEPLNRNCGSCTICIDACPTQAIVAPYTIHAPACISFLTIEERGPIPLDIREKMGDWVYGCDVCQEVCPYTKASTPTDDSDLSPKSMNNAYPSLHWLLQMSPEQYGETYFGTPIPRTKRRGLARNAAVALGNIGGDSDIPILEQVLLDYDEPLVRGHAAWALGRLGGRRELKHAGSIERDAYVQQEISTASAM